MMPAPLSHDDQLRAMLVELKALIAKIERLIG